MLKKLFLKIMKKYSCLLFVGSTDALPEPLPKEEEIKYVELSMNNDKKARNKLIEHNLRLVVFLAKKYDNTNTDLEDLVSIGTIGLIKAVNTYRLDKNIKLATYASRCIDNEILMYLRKTKTNYYEFGYTSDETDIYQLYIYYPTEYDTYEYQNMVENISINIDSKQVLEND